MNSLMSRSSLWSYRKVLLAVIVLSGIGLLSMRSAIAQKPKTASDKEPHEKTVHSAEEHARGVTALKQAFGVSHIDLFFEMGELEALKPALADVKFVDAVDVTGRKRKGVRSEWHCHLCCKSLCRLSHCSRARTVSALGLGGRGSVFGEDHRVLRTR